MHSLIITYTNIKWHLDNEWQRNITNSVYTECEYSIKFIRMFNIVMLYLEESNFIQQEYLIIAYISYPQGQFSVSSTTHHKKIHILSFMMHLYLTEDIGWNISNFFLGFKKDAPHDIVILTNKIFSEIHSRIHVTLNRHVGMRDHRLQKWIKVAEIKFITTATNSSADVGNWMQCD